MRKVPLERKIPFRDWIGHEPIAAIWSVGMAFTAWRNSKYGNLKKRDVSYADGEGKSTWYLTTNECKSRWYPLKESRKRIEMYKKKIKEKEEWESEIKKDHRPWYASFKFLFWKRWQVPWPPCMLGGDRRGDHFTWHEALMKLGMMVPLLGTLDIPHSPLKIDVRNRLSAEIKDGRIARLVRWDGSLILILSIGQAY